MKNNNSFIEVKLFATLRDKFALPADLDLSRPRQIADLLGDINLPAKKVAIIFVDGRHAELTDTVGPGQTLALFPPIGGG